MSKSQYSRELQTLIFTHEAARFPSPEQFIAFGMDFVGQRVLPGAEDRLKVVFSRIFDEAAALRRVNHEGVQLALNAHDEVGSNQKFAIEAQHRDNLIDLTREFSALRTGRPDAPLAALTKMSQAMRPYRSGGSFINDQTFS